MTATARLALPFISPGQAQKEIFHNEALQILDILVGGAVEEGPLVSPPASPAAGACYIVGDSATGDWQGRDGQIAAYTIGGWKYVVPVDGVSLYVRTTKTTAAYRNGGWEYGVIRGAAIVIDGQQVIGSQANAIADPAGGSTVDAEARSAVGAILLALRQHGLIAT